MITIGMAALPSRFENLKEIIPPLLKQCDRMFIHVNGAKECPAFLKNESKIKFSFSSDNLGGQMAFKEFPNTKGYYFCVDDDLIYPNDYIEKMISLMKAHNNRIIACVHGSSFNYNAPIDRVFKNKTNSYLSYKGLEKHSRALIPGVGTSCMHTDSFVIKPSDFPYQNMRDAFIACKAAKEGIPIFAIKRPDNWIKKISGGTAIVKNKQYDQRIDQLFKDHIEYFKKQSG
ncbi:glycosyltransferase [Bacillus sp. JCM 19041]|uniref:glycosyltransferase n=1 Tax=Bacillus sp. JCM 19041 TaxID=1460637 RepID=UPI0006CF5A90